jgi:hypothetical protein
MKPPVIAAVLLALVTPAFAVNSDATHVEIHAKDRPWLPTMRQWTKLHGMCGGADDYSDKLNPIVKACIAAEKLGKKLKANGYCLYGHGEVVRCSRDGKHIYPISY